MNELNKVFEASFRKLTGNPPFPWQAKLFEFFTQGPNAIPSRCDIPTGLGKTSVIACWLLAREVNASLPTRLVYVVNRRTVVDQTTEEVKKYLTAIPALKVSTLRGQFADNREWSADPSMPAVICGTVDMIGSRLLFSGYGIGFKSRPLHAGFLGQDSLIVHDEAHLEPAFQDLLIAIQKEQQHGRFPDRTPLRVMELSATSRSDHEPFRLTEAERRPPENMPKPPSEPIHHVWQRLRSPKAISFVGVSRNAVAETIASLAVLQRDSGRAILIFVRTIEDVDAILKSIRDKKTGVTADQVRILTGTMRGLERDRLLTGDTVFARFMPTPQIAPCNGTVFLLSTSAGEVGIDISADQLICDLVPLDSMIQRLGRVNRRGEKESLVDVVHETDRNAKPSSPKFEAARWATFASLQRLPASTLAAASDHHGRREASPLAIGALVSTLTEAERDAAFTPPPDLLPTADILFDAWSLTTITGKLPGRPAIEPYLHGIADWEPAQTQVAWRTEVGKISGNLLADHPPEELLELYPLKPHELLADRSKRVFDKLRKWNPPTDFPIWVIDDEGIVTPTTHADIVNGRDDAIDGKTILLPPEAGGLTVEGLFDPKAPPDAPVNHDVADEWMVDGRVMRHRAEVSPDDEKPSASSGMRLIRRIDLHDPDSDEDANPTRFWKWFARPNALEPDANAGREYLLDDHTRDIGDAIAAIIGRLNLPDDVKRAVIVAATCHDLGKYHQRWQRSIGNDKYDAEVWAKSGKRAGRRERITYRHEFGSVLDVRSRDEFKALSPEMQDLALHLIAAHHGRARPHFTEAEALDDRHPADCAHESTEVIRRFARLQRRYGRWGLAYLESLVRAADYAASRKAEEGDA